MIKKTREETKQVFRNNDQNWGMRVKMSKRGKKFMKKWKI
jgi:hypothetical protein